MPVVSTAVTLSSLAEEDRSAGARGYRSIAGRRTQNSKAAEHNLQGCLRMFAPSQRRCVFVGKEVATVK